MAERCQDSSSIAAASAASNPWSSSRRARSSPQADARNCTRSPGDSSVACSKRSCSLSSFVNRARHLFLQPCAGKTPVAFHCCKGEIHHLCNLLKIQIAEKAKFYDLCTARIAFGHPYQSLIHRQRIQLPRLLGNGQFALQSTVPFRCTTGASMVHQNAPHEAGYNGDEVTTVLPVDFADLRDP